MATIRNKSVQIHQQRMAYLFIALPVLLLAIFMILPIGMALFVSFTDYDIVNSPNWIGFDNYIKMFRDPYFLISLKKYYYIHSSVCTTWSCSITWGCYLD